MLDVLVAFVHHRHFPSADNLLYRSLQLIIQLSDQFLFTVNLPQLVVITAAAAYFYITMALAINDMAAFNGYGRKKITEAKFGFQHLRTVKTKLLQHFRHLGPSTLALL